MPSAVQRRASARAVTPLCPATASLRPSDLDEYRPNFGDTAVYTYDQAFAFLLGRDRQRVERLQLQPQGQALPQLTGDQRIYRYYQTQLYAADTWKVTPSLTLSYGVNYQIFSVPYETRGLESTGARSPTTSTFGAHKQSAAGLSGPTAVPLISYMLGGKANNGPPIYQPQYNNFAPRFAFAYNPGFDKKTVFNGGAGLVYDRTIINAVQFRFRTRILICSSRRTPPP